MTWRATLSEEERLPPLLKAATAGGASEVLICGKEFGKINDELIRHKLPRVAELYNKRGRKDQVSST